MKIFELVGKIVIDSNGAKEEIERTTATAKKSNENLSKNLLKIGGALLGTTVAIGTALYNVAEETREYRTQMGQLSTAFATQNHNAGAARDTYKALVGVLGDSGQATEAALHIAKLADSEAELKTWTDICTGVFATFGASLPIESLTEAANETAKTKQVTGTLADALNWAGINEDQFNSKLKKCRTEQQRQDLIMNTLIGTYGAAAEQYKETNKEVIASNEAHDNLNSAMSGLGAAAEPAVTALVNAVADIVEFVTPAVKSLCEWVGELIDAWSSAAENLKPIVTSINVGFNTMNQTVSDLQTDPAGTIEKAAQGGESLQTIMKNGVSNYFSDAWEKVKKNLGFASGLDFVPHNNMPASLHYGEAVLTREDAAAWRSRQAGNADALTAAMEVMTAAIVKAIREMDDGMETKFIQALASMKFDVNNREFARLVKAVT